MRDGMDEERSLVERWPAEHVCVAAVGPDGLLSSTGDLEHRFALASVTKPLVATAVLVAVEEGAVDLDGPCGPDGSTVRHLLAHASGIAPDDRTVLVPPGRRRIYSNSGFEILAEHLATATGIGLADYLREGVFEPLGMDDSELVGSPGAGATSTVADLALWVQEWLSPGRLLHPSTVAEATTVQYPELSGVLPGYGTQTPNPWGLGVEIRGHKWPHWSGTQNSPATYGHFGKSGTFVWIDPVARLGLVGLGDTDFGQWAVDLWPVLNDAVLAEHRRD
ncbi:MAG: serine hydrolase domain-containing protein [Acidimicrobiales bacterium]